VNSYKVVRHKLPLHLAFEFTQTSLNFYVFKILILVVFLVKMAFKALNFVKKNLIVVKCENLKKKRVTKRKREKLVKVNHTLGCFDWTITNFASKFNLQVEGLNPHKNLVFSPHLRRWFLYLAKDSKMAKRCE
jgi:hypothetical protein